MIKVSRTEVYFSDTKKELEEEILRIKKDLGEKVIKESITKKKRKGIEYYILETTIEERDVKDIIDEIKELYGDDK